jgi:gliding motility-associated-like protein
MDDCIGQLSIPWGHALNVTFGRGGAVTGSPLSTGYTSFIYTTDPCPLPGYYTVTNKQTCTRQKKSEHDAGYIYMGAFPLVDDSGYLMLVTTSPSPYSKLLFSDTVKNLCSGMEYLFWGAMWNVTPRGCYFPDFTYSIENISGNVIQSYQTGDIGAGTDLGTWYPGHWIPSVFPDIPYYGGSFIIPPGINEVVVKIIQNPSTAYSYCQTYIAVDNIFLTPVGPNIKITTTGNPDAFIASTCFDGHNPLILNGSIESGYLKFGTPNYIFSTFSNPVFQWQRSIDDNASTWMDIPGENSLNFSHAFTQPDSFYVRLKVSESANAGNLNCGVISNVIAVRVNDYPANGKFTSNSPVCTGDDVIFNLEGGSKYIVTGPNNFFDGSHFPHVYHPALADSGWYYAQIISTGGCIALDSIDVKIYGPDVKAGPGQSICFGQTAQLSSSGGIKYEWSPTSGLSNPNIPNPTASPTITTRYEVKVMDETQCPGYGHTVIKVLNGLLKAEFTGPEVACPNDVWSFADTSVGEIVDWKWDFGNGEISNGRNPVQPHYPNVNQVMDYTVKLIVTDTSGCTDTAFHITKIPNNCYIAVPSAFTPNSDGLNDFLYPLNAYKATNLSFRVFNRNGQRVFEGKDWTQKWDGSINGVAQPGGVYVWILTYTDEKQMKISLKGTTVLIR